MSCGCPKIERTGLWTSVPDYRQPTEIQPGENIDCYMKRAGSVYNEQNVIGPKPVNRINNTYLVSDTDGNVSDTFKLTPESDKTPTNWTATINGVPIDTALPGVTFNNSTGQIGGQVAEADRGKNYNVLVTASDGAGEIDSRSYNFFPKDGKEDTIRFLFPLVGPGARITSTFGPRNPPASGASRQHRGIDLSCTGNALGDIIASADGIVRNAGPASGFGNWIIIDHRDSSNKLVASTLYAHMNEMYVRVGQRVSAGQKIAKEGNAGIGSGAHLHFEIHKGGYKNPVDPVPYLEGQVEVPNNNTNQLDERGAAAPDPNAGTTIVNNTNSGMTAREGSAMQECSPNSTSVNANDPSQSVVSDMPNPVQDEILPENVEAAEKAAEEAGEEPKNKCKGVSGQTYTPDEILQIINEECAAAGLDAEETTLLRNIARIESSLNPYATNPKSSATGLFQMLNKTSAAFYEEIGVPNPTCEQRADPRLATKAQIAWLKKEWRPAWESFALSGKTKISGNNITPTSFSGESPPHYNGLSKAEFMYVLHHDGVGTMRSGRDLGGLSYWRRRITG